MSKKSQKYDPDSNSPVAKAARLEREKPQPLPPQADSSPATSARPVGLVARAWVNAKEFSGFGGGGDVGMLWPRWLVLRAVGLVFVFIFAGIVVEGPALLGPRGIVPLESYFAQLKHLVPGTLAAFFKAPSFFWFGTGVGTIAMMAWGGLLASIALVLNLWPRMALFLCWAVFLSFVTTWGEFSPAQLDRLMLEAAVLCIPFAPRGMRPGLGASSPPRPIAVFMMRWLLFRVMVESGMVKLVSQDPHWRNLTAMDVMYETSPSPTILGYWVHQMPHAYHVLEIAFTFAAELLAPALAVFGGRRGRWIALLLWSLLQVGIQLTGNFGWLNTAAFGLGLLLLDDRMIVAGVDKLGWRRVGKFLFDETSSTPARPVAPWRLHSLRWALGLHFCLTIYYFAKAAGMPVEALPAAIDAPVNFFAEFRSANGYYLYANFDDAHYQVDFEGSSDAGKSWRTYEYRHVPQRVDERPRFFAPRFARFETTLEIQSPRPSETSVIKLVAAHLLAGNLEVVRLFRRDPFPEGPPRAVRMRLYRLAFTDGATLKRTGHYWRKELVGDYQPAIYVTEQGGLGTFSLAEGDAAFDAGNYRAAFSLYERQYHLGNLDAAYRLADMYARGLGVAVQPDKVFALFSELAGQGELKAVHNLAVCYENGIGVRVDDAKAAQLYRAAADRGNLASSYALGVLSARDRLVPRNDVEGLAFLFRAAKEAAGSDDPLAKFIRADEPAQANLLMGRMRPADVSEAHALAEAARR